MNESSPVFEADEKEQLSALVTQMYNRVHAQSLSCPLPEENLIPEQRRKLMNSLQALMNQLDQLDQ
jgi:hypothetical protein